MDMKERDELLASLKANKKELLAAKQSQVKFTDSFTGKATFREESSEKEEDTIATKAAKAISRPGHLPVTVVCNTAWFCDSQNDVIIDTAYDNSVKAKGITVPHIADHKQSSTSHVGDVTALYTKTCRLKDLGLDAEGTTTALIMETDIREDYNADVFKFYSNGKINQHSIGLRYSKIDLAINNNTKEYEVEKAVWDKYYPKILNKDAVDKQAYFYAVEEIDLMENSCVLFGANSLTPTLSSPPQKNLGVLPPVIEEVPPSTPTIKGITMTTEEKLIALMAEHETLKASVSLDVGKATQLERQRCKAILEAGDTFGIAKATVLNVVSKSYDLEQVRDMFTDLAAAKAEATGIKTGAADLSSADAVQLAALKAAADAATPKSFEEEVAAGFKALGETTTLFAGMN